MAEEEQAAGGTSTDPAGVSLALAGASRGEADAYLRDQRHHLHEDLKQIGLRLWELRMGVALRVATLIIGLAAATGLGLLVWDAAHSKGLIIEPFSVPPDLAARGLTGEVVAGQMLDRLIVMQDATVSGRSAQSYANNWGDNLKVEIPETGVSIGELQTFLKNWLGHDTHISGQVWRTQSGIAVTARTGGEAGATFTGAESDLPALIQQAAEHVYGVTQPYRYANYIVYRGSGAPDAAQRAQAEAIYRKLVEGPSSRERAWAWNGLGSLVSGSDIYKAIFYYRKSTLAEPDFTMGYFALGFLEPQVGRYEIGLSDARTAQRLLDRNTVSEINPVQLPLRRLRNSGVLARLTGDYSQALASFRAGADTPINFVNLGRGQYVEGAVLSLADLHDGGGLRVYMRDQGISPTVTVSVVDAITNFVAAYDGEDWPAVLRLETSMPQNGRRRMRRGFTMVQPIIAVAHARLGDMKGAEALIKPCPADSDDCLMARGQIAELQGQHARADWWFDRAEKQQPSIPFADTAWGQTLLKRGASDKAIEKFQRANRLGPKFADALEGWGEALMAKNQSHLALEKFAEANKYAPNWGRLHLKWGEALVYARKRDDARAQFARAAALDLNASEKSELATVPHV